ncbi:MAG: hypothetical protein JWN78_2576 [Bacteroidota bacterium]|nr:hypothetical protein [Bacteroidota bacterium]
MKNFILFLFALALFSCKKTELPAELRIKIAKYYRNDSLMGQAEYGYNTVTGLLETERIQLNINNYFVQHTYNYMNDSIEIDENMFNGVDTVRNLVVLYITGTNHLVSKINVFSKPFLVLTAQRNYVYDGSSHLTQINRFATKELYDFLFTGGDLSSYKILSPGILTGTDTTQFDLTYTTKATQRGINFNSGINPDAVPGFMENTINVDLAGCTFNTAANLVLTSQQEILGQITPGGQPVTSYSYTFDNHGRVESKIYSTQTGGFPATGYRTAYTYM